MQTLNNIAQWLGIAGIGFGALWGVAWFFGLTSLFTTVLRIAASVFEILSPILRAAVEAFIEYLKICWEGFIDVIDNWKTIVFVVSLCLVAVGVYHFKRQDHKVIKTQKVVIEQQAKKLCQLSKKECPKKATPKKAK